MAAWRQVALALYHAATAYPASAAVAPNRADAIWGQIEKFEPERAQCGRFCFTLREIRLGPYRDALRLLFQPLQPHPLRRKNVRHQLQRSLVRAARGSDRVQDFPVRPFIVGELAA